MATLHISEPKWTMRVEAEASLQSSNGAGPSHVSAGVGQLLAGIGHLW